MQMTNSSLIEFEATKLAEAVHAEMNKQSFIDLEDIRPPSTMGSLVSLSASMSADNCLPETKSKGTPVTVRKKSLPVGMVAKRAVANQLQYAGSLESLTMMKIFWLAFMWECRIIGIALNFSSKNCMMSKIKWFNIINEFQIKCILERFLES